MNIHNHNGNVAVNGTITINTKDYANSDEIQELLELLKQVPKVIKKIINTTKDKIKVFKDDDI